jgi:hypothetical protein
MSQIDIPWVFVTMHINDRISASLEWNLASRGLVLACTNPVTVFHDFGKVRFNVLLDPRQFHQYCRRSLVTTGSS